MKINDTTTIDADAAAGAGNIEGLLSRYNVDSEDDDIEKQRRKLYPLIYSDAGDGVAAEVHISTNNTRTRKRDIGKELKRYAVEVPDVYYQRVVTNKKTRRRQRRVAQFSSPSSLNNAIEPGGGGVDGTGSTDVDHDGKETSENKSNNNLTGEDTTAAPAMMVTRQQSYAQSDVWGRIPPKEPKYMVRCGICNRLVNAMRFAPHLDKCMALGVGSRLTTGAGGGTKNNSGGSGKSKSSSMGNNKNK